jgi:hypothetical protein
VQDAVVQTGGVVINEKQQAIPVVVFEKLFFVRKSLG